jgi:hypothetical protein
MFWSPGLGILNAFLIIAKRSHVGSAFACFMHNKGNAGANYYKEEGRAFSGGKSDDFPVWRTAFSFVFSCIGQAGKELLQENEMLVFVGNVASRCLHFSGGVTGAGKETSTGIYPSHMACHI